MRRLTAKRAEIRLDIIALTMAAFLHSHPASAQTYPFQFYTTADGLPQSTVSCLFQDSHGYMWFGTAGGISRYDSKRFLSYRNSAFRVLCIAEDAQGIVWVGTTAGIARCEPDNASIRITRWDSVALPSEEVRTLLRDRLNNMWVGTDNGVVVITAAGNTLMFDHRNGLQHDRVQRILQDEEGRILIASFGGVMRCRLHDSVLINQEPLLTEPVSTICIAGDTDLVASSLKHYEVLRYRNGRWESIFSPKDLGGGIYASALAQEGNGNTWIGTSQGLVIVQGHSATVISKKQGLRNVFITSICQDAEGDMWMGTEGGVAKLPKPLFQNYDLAAGLPGDHVIAMFQDSNRNFWFGTYQGAARIEPGGRVTIFNKGLPHLSVHDICEDVHGHILVGTFAGLMGQSKSTTSSDSILSRLPVNNNRT